MSVTANGWGSRERGRTVLKRIQHARKQDDSNPLAITTVEDSDGIVDVKPLRVSSDRVTPTKKSSTRLENLIMEAITSLKEPTGSNKTAIALYIEDQYWSPPNFKRILSAKLKALTASRKLIKVKRKYRIAPGSYFSGEKDWAAAQPSEAGQEKPKVITKAQVEAELTKIRSMTAQEAAAAAAQAVAEAEAAIAEAEAAAREAEKAEAEAEEAQAFAEAAMLALKSRNAVKLVNSLPPFPLQAQTQQS